MATTIQLENTFSDNSKRQLNIGTIDDDSPNVNIATLKANIRAVNSNPSFANYYLSTGGASFVSISGATINTESITEIDLS